MIRFFSVNMALNRSSMSNLLSSPEVFSFTWYKPRKESSE